MLLALFSYLLIYVIIEQGRQISSSSQFLYAISCLAADSLEVGLYYVAGSFDPPH